MTKRLGGILAVATIAAIGGAYLVAKSQYCPYDYYAETSFVEGNDGEDKPARARHAQRNTIQKLSEMIKECPKTSRYIVTWSYDGEGPMGGYVPGKTVFDRKKAEFRESNDDSASGAPELLHKISGVSVADIHAVAGVKGDTSILKRRLKRLHQN